MTRLDIVGTGLLVIQYAAVSILFYMLLTSISGCNFPPPSAQAPEISLTEGSPEEVAAAGSRFQIHKEATFRDELSYHRERAVYILTDTETGKQYVGISGVGISELGDHKQGKQTVEDER
jgi:hypothetical protein